MIIFLFQKKNIVKLFKKVIIELKFLKDFLSLITHCKSKNIFKNDSRLRKIKYIPIQNYNVELELSVQRYICKECKKREFLSFYSRV